MTNLSFMLRAYCQKHDVTVRDLAKATGISIATISRIQRGHAMDADTMLKLLTWMMRGST